MLKTAQEMLPRDPDPAIFSWLEHIENTCLILLFLISSANLAAWLMPAPGWSVLIRWQPMQPEAALAALFSTLCLMFLGTGQTRWKKWISPLLAVVVILLAASALFKFIPNFPGLPVLLAYTEQVAKLARIDTPSAGAFLVLGFTMLAMTVENRIAVWLSDLLTLLLCGSTLTVISSYLFGKWSLFGAPAAASAHCGTLACLVLLTIIAFLRRTENGIFSIYTGSGNGGKLARILTPILMLIPFLRETSRARIIGVRYMPAENVTALLASTAVVISIALLLYLVWRINRVETEIHALALRDELTGLYNLRGFKLFAEHAMRMAQRSKVPFSVVFIDLDDLKVINDSLGHKVGSAYISEAAEILRATFRETDVLGRIGGDEFAAAGAFSRRSIATAVHRLKNDCARRNSREGRQFALSFSVGLATLENKKETLEQLMAKADAAMYEAKRSKKEQRASQEENWLREPEKATRG